MSIERFLPPQERTHADALRELTAGRKQGHWIWWELPQLSILARSDRAVRYGLGGQKEAKAFLAHPVLGARLLELCDALMGHAGTKADDILGPVDALKVRSMATLFASLPEAPPVFQSILDAFYDGSTCETTVRSVAGRSAAKKT